MADGPYDEFRQVMAGREETVDLARAALTVAKLEFPQLDLANYLSRIDQLAVAVGHRAGSETNAGGFVAALNTVLFHELGFHGNRDDYYNAMNSYLNEVIDRRTGIPITLSVLYMEVARRVGLPLRGVGFPGHFLVKYVGPGDQFIIDPFDGGKIRSRESLEQLLDTMSGGGIVFRMSFLEAVSKAQILMRMLNNLKGCYAQENDSKKTLSVLEHQMILNPLSPELMRERGIVYLRLEWYKLALADLESYLRLRPEAHDATAVRRQIERLSAKVAGFH